MAQSQGPKNDVGSHTQDTHKSGKKKSPTDSGQRIQEGFPLSEAVARTDRVDQQVEELNDLSQRVGQAQLAIGVWVLENVFRLKNPKRKKSFAALSKHASLDSTRRRSALRRYVLAATNKRP